MKKQICTELDNRAIFRGDYNGHECAIDLTNVQLSDNGADHVTSLGSLANQSEAF